MLYMQLPCPDGFLLEPDDSLRSAHLRLNDFLIAEQGRNAALIPFDLKPWRKLPKRELPQQTLAILRRILWLHEHDTQLEGAHKSRIQLAMLLRTLYTIKAEATEEDLIAIINASTSLLGRISPHGPIDRVKEYLKKNDLTPDVCRSIRKFQANLLEGMSESQASMQSLRQTLHILLWMDEWEPLNPAKCWSECIRRDFREMDGERRIRWRALLKHLRGNAPVRMPKGWARDAAPLIEKVGLEDFKDRIASWFAPFRSGQPLPLSVAGSHVLKGLIWYCAVAGDQNLKGCALWLLDVKWRQKRNTAKSMLSLKEFGITEEELLTRKLIKERVPDPMGQYLEKLRASLFSICDRIVNDPDEDLVIIQGQMHFYRICRSTGRIERVSDKSALELNWHSLPDQFRSALNRVPGSASQVGIHAFMLMNDGIFARYFKEASDPNGVEIRSQNA